VSVRRAPSLRLVLATTFVAVAIAPTLLLGLVATRFAVGRVREQVAARNEQVASAISAEVGRAMEGHLVHLKEVAFALEEGPRPVHEIEELLAIHVRADTAVREIQVIDRSGVVARVAPANPDVLGSDLSGHRYVREAWATGKPTWSSATISIRTGDPVVGLVVPGEVWTVVGEFDLATLEEIVLRTRASAEAEVSVIDRGGTFIAHGDPRVVREQESARGLALVQEALAGRGTTAEFDFGGRAWLGSALAVRQTGWVVLVAEPVERAYEKVSTLRNTMLLLLALVIGTAALAGAWSARWIVRRVEALSAGARTIAAGEYRLALPGPERHGIREVDDLTASFAAMAAAVSRREEELARSERSYRTIVGTPLVGVVRTTLGGEILVANEAFAGMCGVESGAALLGRHVGVFWADPGERARVVERTLETGAAVNVEMGLRSVKGQERHLLINVARDGDTLTTVAVDITDRKRADAERQELERQLFHSQRLEAVGRLAGGIAHDFNNLLTAVVGFASALRESLPDDHPERESVDGILDASNRATQLTRGLLAYGRKQVLQPRPTDVRDVLRSVEKLLRHVVGEDVDLAVTLPDEPLVAVVDPGQIEQVLVNLSANARDAMPKGGSLRITAAHSSVAEDEAARLGLSGGGAFVRITVADSGSGMTPEVAARVFEPFYTTKASGKGTGLGLAIVYGIVRQHGGAVALRSGPGEGTEAMILLPGAVRAEAAPSATAGEPADGGHETILFGEDDPLVRKALRRALERAGYEVIEAVDGEDAVEQFARNQDRVALCLLDVVMPRKNGREAAEAIAAIRPGVRVLLASGYTADVLEDRGLPPITAEIIAKPVAPEVLLRKVRAMIDGTG